MSPQNSYVGAITSNVMIIGYLLEVIKFRLGLEREILKMRLVPL